MEEATPKVDREALGEFVESLADGIDALVAGEIGEEVENNYIIVSNYEDDEDGVLYWSNEDGWGHRSTATLFTEADTDTYDGLSLPIEAAGWVRVSSAFQTALSADEVMVDEPNLKWADNE
jgi:hypothetical protein